MRHGTSRQLSALASLGRMAAANDIAMVTSTLDGIRDANDAFLRLAGCTREDLTAGRVHWRLLTAPEWTSVDDSAVAELRATGSYGPHLKEYRRNDGTRLTVEVTGVMLSQEPPTWVTFIRDAAAEPDDETLTDSAGRLAALAAELARDVTVSDVARTLTRHVRQSMGAIGATIMEVDPAGRFMRPVLTGEIPAPIAQGYAEFDTRLDTASTRAWRDRKLAFYPDPPTIDETFPHLAAVRAASGVGSCMAVPLVAASEVTGVLAVYWSASRQLSADEEAFTTAVSGYAAQALARARLFEAEQAARGRLQALQAVTAGLATAVTSDQIAEVLVEEGMRLVAGHGVVAMLGPGGDHLRTWPTRNFPTEIAHSYARIPLGATDDTPVEWTTRTGQRIILSSLSEIAERFPQVAFTHEVTGTSSLLCIPVRAGRRTIGALAFGFTDEGSPADGLIPVAETLAELTGQALERAQRYEAEHATAHQLQQALLPKVPAELPGVCIGAAYLPAEPGQDVGGDWYDVFELPGGKIGCASGDVVGHDLAAAVAMGRLQLLLRYIALSGARPTEVLEALDRACPALTGTDFATVAYAEYDPAGPTLTYACAGHPPPLLADGHTVRYLDEARSGPLGFGGARPQAAITVPPAARLVLYTDGLVERRGRSIDDGFGRLARVVGELPAGHTASACDRLLILMTHGDTLSDDVAVICIDLNGPAARPLPPDAGHRRGPDRGAGRRSRDVTRRPL